MPAGRANQGIVPVQDCNRAATNRTSVVPARVMRACLPWRIDLRQHPDARRAAQGERGGRSTVCPPARDHRRRMPSMPGACCRRSRQCGGRSRPWLAVPGCLIACGGSEIWCPRRESNPDLPLRRGLLYPFNYGDAAGLLYRLRNSVARAGWRGPCPPKANVYPPLPSCCPWSAFSMTWPPKW